MKTKILMILVILITSSKLFSQKTVNEKKSQTVKEEKTSYYQPLMLSKTAKFVGGENQITKYLKENLNHSIIEDYVYSNEGNHLIKLGDEYEYIRLTTSIIIKDDGTVLLKEIYERVNKDVYNEIKRIIENMPKWKPALDENKSPVTVLHKLPLLIFLG